MSIALAITITGFIMVLIGLLGLAMERFVSYQGQRRAERFQAEAVSWAERMERIAGRKPRATIATTEHTV